MLPPVQQELDFSGCSGGELIGESILLHVAARCTGLKSVDASWSNVSDNGVQALAEQVERYITLLNFNNFEILEVS